MLQSVHSYSEHLQKKNNKMIFKTLCKKISNLSYDYWWATITWISNPPKCTCSYGAPFVNLPVNRTFQWYINYRYSHCTVHSHVTRLELSKINASSVQSSLLILIINNACFDNCMYSYVVLIVYFYNSHYSHW